MASAFGVIASAVTLPYTLPEWVEIRTPILQLCPSGPSTGQLEVGCQRHFVRVDVGAKCHLAGASN